MKRVELVGELERLAERFWGRDYVKAATLGEAAKVYRLIADAAERPCPEIREDKAELAALVADWAGNARRRAVSPVGPFAVDEDAAGADGDAGEPSAEVRRALKGGQALLLRLEFAFEFAQLAHAFFGVCTRGGELVLECGDFAATKKRAEALKGLAAWIDDLEDGKEIGDAHAAIVAYLRARLRTYGGAE